jgi:hypothetical protein
MDTETPVYCRKEKTEDPILADYRFFVNEEPHMSWEGFICKAWIKIKKSTVSFSEVLPLVVYMSCNAVWPKKH